MAATVATPLDAGWSAPRPDLWITDSEVEWRFPPASSPDFGHALAGLPAVLDEFEESVDRRLCAGASLHQCGDDLAARGADTLHVQREQRRFEANGDDDLWALNLAVVTGAQWTRDRQPEAGYELESLMCGRCGKEKYSLFHRIWSCECNT